MKGGVGVLVADETSFVKKAGMRLVSGGNFRYGGTLIDRRLCQPSSKPAA